MILDSSAIIAVIQAEPGADRVAAAIQSAGRVRISAATLLETSIVARPERFERVEALLDAAGVEVVAFDAAQLLIARGAHAAYGRGSGSKARLNFGDCFSYALAITTGEPLLYVGDDFTHTDVTSALG